MGAVGPAHGTIPERAREARLAPALLLQPQGPFDPFSVFLSDISYTNCWHVKLNVSQAPHIHNLTHHLSAPDCPSPVSPVTKIHSTSF